MDLDWLLDACDREDPLDVAALLGCGVELLVTTTSADSGEPVYLEPRADDASTLLKASSALPILYRGPVLLRGQRLVDGGVAAPIPVREAYRRGARRILVVRTRARGVTKQVGFEHYIGALAFATTRRSHERSGEVPQSTRHRSTSSRIRRRTAPCSRLRRRSHWPRGGRRNRWLPSSRTTPWAARVVRSRCGRGPRWMRMRSGRPGSCRR
jgi:predicted acylesterase/phospholipase RssA